MLLGFTFLLLEGWRGEREGVSSNLSGLNGLVRTRHSRVDGHRLEPPLPAKPEGL